MQTALLKFRPGTDYGQVLYVGAPCAGRKEDGRWTCRCRAKSPKGCRTETAPGCPPVGVTSPLAFELLKRDPKVARQALVVQDNIYAKVKKPKDIAREDRERVKCARALLEVVRAVQEGESIAWKKLLLKAKVPQNNAAKSALRVLVARQYLFKHGSCAWTTYRPNRKNQEPYIEP